MWKVKHIYLSFGKDPEGRRMATLFTELRFQCATSFRSFELLNQNQLESNYHKRTDAMSRA